jgi:SpoIVB peptidase S55
MSTRRFLSVLGLTLLAASALWAQDTSKFFPLSEVQPGLKGTGLTIFEGNQIQEFQVEFVGVLKNAIAPKHDVILARLSGGPIAKTGVIAGMSGSPVYVNGKLVGAVALSFPFATEAYAGITPIEDMLSVVPANAAKGPAVNEKAQQTATLNLRAVPIPGLNGSVGRLIPDERIEQGDWTAFLPTTGGSQTFSSLRLPLRFGGFSADAMRNFASAFRQMGFEPMQSGLLTGSPASFKTEAFSGSGQAKEQSAREKIEPGSMISVLLVEGDLNLNVDCTVTLLQGDNLYACGHRFLMSGPVEFPFAPSHVLATIPSLASSFKVDAPGTPVGSIRQDRFGAIYGVVGDKARMIPVHIRVDSTLNRQDDYHFEMIRHDFISPLLVNLAVNSALSATERVLGPSTLDVKGSIRLSDGETVDIGDIISGDTNVVGVAGASVAKPLAYLLQSGFPKLDIEGIELSVTASNVKSVATIEQAWSTKSEVHPGDHLDAIVVLRTSTGESEVERIPIEIPLSVRDKMLTLVVGSGPTINALENRLGPLGTPLRDLHQLVQALNRMRRNNRLYALLMAPQRSFVLQGDEYPSPPPSLVQTFLADPAVASSVLYRGTSVVGDFETKPSPYSIEGQKTLMLRVVEEGP